MEIVTIIFKTTKDLKEKIKQRAKNKYGITMSGYIKMLIMKDLDSDEK